MANEESDKQKSNSNHELSFSLNNHFHNNKKFLKICLPFFTLILIYSILFIFYRTVTNFDTALFLEINKTRTPPLEDLFVVITKGGTFAFIISIILVLWIMGERRPALYLAVGLILDAILVYIFKISIHRPRPYEVFSIQTLELGDSFGSLPSGHTSRAFLCATILSNFYRKYIIIFFLIALSVGFSRVYIGSHYPFDVIIGAINGILIGIIVVNLLDGLIRS